VHHHPLIQAIATQVLNSNNNRLLHLVADNPTDENLPTFVHTKHSQTDQTRSASGDLRAAIGLTQYCEDPRNLTSHHTEPVVVRDLARGKLEAQIEQLLPGLGQSSTQGSLVQLPQR